MSLLDNDRVQEVFLVLGDKFTEVNKKWWYALGICLVALVPFYYLIKLVFVQIEAANYSPPKIVYASVAKEPLQIIDKKALPIGNNTYAGFVKVKNINSGWGVAVQGYTAVFKTFGGTVLSTTTSQTFILPASEKLIVLPRFASTTPPDEVSVTLADTNFIHKPDVPINLELERVNIQNTDTGLSIYAGIKNLIAFKVKQIDLPVIVYNNKNEIVGVNYTYINDVASGETRTFQYLWPTQIPAAVRAEINPEINIFNRNIFTTEEGVSPFINQ